MDLVGLLQLFIGLQLPPLQADGTVVGGMEYRYLGFVPWFLTSRAAYHPMREQLLALARCVERQLDGVLERWMAWVDPRASMPLGHGWWSYTGLMARRRLPGYCTACGWHVNPRGAHRHLCVRLEFIIRIFDMIQGAHTLHAKLRMARAVLDMRAPHGRHVPWIELMGAVGFLQVSISDVLPRA
jgi:hypothetical protein